MEKLNFGNYGRESNERATNPRLINVLEVNETTCKKEIKYPMDVVELMKDEAKADREIFYVLHLDARNRIIQKEINTIGTVDKSAVYIREVFRSALYNQSVAIISVHNHPSGNVEPSENDEITWRKINKAGDLLDIDVLDHIIISPDLNCYSAKEHFFK
ncbi:MAG: hypothetical protein JW740_02680 [Candidatus Zambryskibacteria bacterium]|nr:hypothetical protein [Candidatus Zambryskibacteria bacterium]